MDARGTMIAGKYELVEVAGSGGMATVWHATQHGPAGFRRSVALKRIKEHVAQDPEFVRMFVEEARVCAQLVHPNIVQIHDFGDEGGLYFLVMEWVDGLSFAQFLQIADELDTFAVWPLVAAVAIEAARGLTAAHERLDDAGNPAPVFHRDVTPQNILLAKNGLVKLTDFGLARAMDRARITEPNVIKGKVGYLAPELTKERRATVKTDIYALGVVLWQALCGQPLFHGSDNIEIFLKASRGEVPPIVEPRPDVPVGFAAIVERSLARDPEDRFGTAAQMGRVIANMLRSEDVSPDATFLARSVSQVCHFRDHGQLPPSSRPPPAS
ncbi:MAG: serine/threonine protein kinase [Deltaproteobacteria bacterium]|nr:serine/threonine protein kinase [Deltaproteobacteria bacterium]